MRLAAILLPRTTDSVKTAQHIMFIYSYSKVLNFEKVILVYSFTTGQLKLVNSLIPFEKEDTNFAPEPSVGCGFVSDDGQEFAILLLQVSRKLLIYAEEAANAEDAADTFRDAFQMLAPLEIPVT